MSHPSDPELLAITDEGGCDLNRDLPAELTKCVLGTFRFAAVPINRRSDRAVTYPGILDHAEPDLSGPVGRVSAGVVACCHERTRRTDQCPSEGHALLATRLHVLHAAASRSALASPAGRSGQHMEGPGRGCVRALDGWRQRDGTYRGDRRPGGRQSCAGRGRGRDPRAVKLWEKEKLRLEADGPKQFWRCGAFSPVGVPPHCATPDLAARAFCTYRDGDENSGRNDRGSPFLTRISDRDAVRRLPPSPAIEFVGRGHVDSSPQCPPLQGCGSVGRRDAGGACRPLQLTGLSVGGRWRWGYGMKSARLPGFRLVTLAGTNMAHPETGELIPACVQHSVLDPEENKTLRTLLPVIQP